MPHDREVLTPGGHVKSRIIFLTALVGALFAPFGLLLASEVTYSNPAGIDH
jgi:hypothetical protein